jgi:hypothetical protein
MSGEILESTGVTFWFTVEPSFWEKNCVNFGSNAVISVEMLGQFLVKKLE